MASTPPQITAALLDSLRSSLKNSKVVTPGSQEYQESIARWSETGVKPAGVVVFPLDAADVSTTVLFAQEHQLDLAVKGGGHSVSGTSSSDGGLVIDLSNLTNVKIDPAQKTATVQGGALWRHVDEAAIKHGLATVGGTVNHTGVGGLTLGGGYGWLSGQYGLTIDNLLSATIVVADGRVLTASPEENSDLFWALRGAGHNFGVVVEFKFQLYDQASHVFAGMLFYTPDKVEPVIEALNSSVQREDPKAGAICAFALPPGAPTPMIAVVCFYNGPESAGGQHFSELLALGPINNTLGMIPYEQLNALTNQMASYGGRKSFKGAFFNPPVRPTFARHAFTELSAKVQGDPDMAGSGLLLEFFDMRKTCEVPLAATAFASRNSTQNGLILLRWTDATQDGNHRAWARQFQSLWFEEYKFAHGDTEQAGVPQYINYAEPGDSAISNIYGGNLPRLQQVKAAYDPMCIFGKMNLIRPAS